MKTDLKKFEKADINRITQLVNKTNQFNLTVRRLDLKEIADISKSSNFLTISGNLKDKFGDNGLTTIFIGKIKKQTIDIVVWLMSCRVFNRNLELALFDHLINLCQIHNYLAQMRLRTLMTKILFGPRRKSKRNNKGNS